MFVNRDQSYTIHYLRALCAPHALRPLHVQCSLRALYALHALRALCAPHTLHALRGLCTLCALPALSALFFSKITYSCQGFANFMRRTY